MTTLSGKVEQRCVRSAWHSSHLGMWLYSSTSILTCGGGGRFLSHFEPPGASGAMEDNTFQRNIMDKFCANLVPRPLPEGPGDEAGSVPEHTRGRMSQASFPCHSQILSLGPEKI